MAEWTLTRRDDGNNDYGDRFWVAGPFEGTEVAQRFGRLFPPDAPIRVERAGGGEEAYTVEDLPHIRLAQGDRLALPGIPVAAGPLLYVMERLLGPEGCPWDKQQTPDSLLRYLLDESYEASEALVAGDFEGFAEELGDVLLQVVFQGALLPHTTFAAIAEREAEKLVRRHPHVFGGAKVAQASDVRQQWETLKAREPAHAASATWVYPALVAARRAGKAGVEPQSAVYQDILASLEVYFDKNPGKIEEILADAAWAVSESGRRHHADAEWALWKRVVDLQQGPQGAKKRISQNLGE
ncbi:MAG: nucleotide pyrophosphohydrolase [Firmicutes bacterium]|nr:nucleotide pyrophosphohydrolase [Bacillota bacterium]